LHKTLERGRLSKRQPMSNEVEGNLTLFLRRFLNTPEEMDAHLGF
jgi:hypothetical protein